MRVPLPPRQAPSAKLHHNGSRLVIPMPPMSWIIGIIVATNGILSRNAEAMALSHKMSIEVNSGSPPVNLIACSANCLIVPVSTKPPTRTNRPTKKKIVGHSTD
ncbi:hypothetical protein D1872_295020 [compost metagenome]